MVQKLCLERKRRCFHALKMIIERKAATNRTICRPLDILRIYQKRMAFNKYRKVCITMREMGRRDSLVGADLRLKEFKYQLSLFDKALEKLHNEKASRKEISQMKLEYKSTNLIDIFSDLR